MLTLQEKLQADLDKEDFSKVVSICEDAIQDNPKTLEYSWYLGIAYLLQGDEETAQLVWWSTIAEHEDDSLDWVCRSLVKILSIEAERLASMNRFREAIALRYHIREFDPQLLENLFLLVELLIELNDLDSEKIEELNIVTLLESKDKNIEQSLLLRVCRKVLHIPAAFSIEFTKACFPYFIESEQWIQMVNETANEMAYQKRLVSYAIDIVKLCLQHAPSDNAALGYLPRFHLECQQFSEAVVEARNFLLQCSTPESKFFATTILLSTLMSAGDWEQIPVAGDLLKGMIWDFVDKQSTELSLNLIRFLILSPGAFLYHKDDLENNRLLQNQAAQLFQKNIEANVTKVIQPGLKKQKLSTDRLKVGYIASTLRCHSVGWLSRWLFQYHDRDKFEFYIYQVNQRQDDAFFEEWFAHRVNHVRYLEREIGAAVKTIRNDEIDILIDLDSITLDQTCNIMALKPAPVQATWLGYDASGLESIDYYIADHYVLPDNAQAYYQEKIWRLPSTYIAVDGFETGVPTLRRSDLNIPENAVVFWSSQAGLKRNPNIVRLQMKILKGVHNSVFLVKGSGDQNIIRDFFIQIAQSEGVSEDCLRFLPTMANEYIHRANIQLADVVLDTYPYNGATTTLETLWAGVPLVTRVGQQFSARNSYAFLMNVGVTEGIAWTDEEYIDWGVRFGQDEKLRSQVSWKLKQSRHTSPLWNTKQFTHDMENAYREMWKIYQDS